VVLNFSSSGSVSTPPIRCSAGSSIPDRSISSSYGRGRDTGREELVRGHIGRLDGDPRHGCAAEVIGIRPLYAKLSAFAVSSFYAGVAGALWGFIRLGAWEPLAFNVNLSLNLLFMIIIGGMGSLLGSYFGAAFIVVLPLLLNQAPAWFGVEMSTAFASHLEAMIFGSLIVFFLIAEPHGLARLWAIGKEKLRLWPFPH
jgi:branched-chain amino acid transport system permease protein